MREIEQFIDKIICGDTLEVLKQMPSDSVDCIITSPPYWGLRDYGEATCKVWGGNPDCEHEWEIVETERPNASGGKADFAKEKFNIKGKENFREFVGYHNRVTRSSFCKKCGAWHGQLGLEPTLDMYIEHLLQITAELKRVLKPTGVMFWNHGDNYATKSGSGKIYENIAPGYEERIGSAGLRSNDLIENQGIPRKSLCMQNYRLILHMVDEQGWILRNIIIWFKPNHMPSSAKDRFTNSYEPVFMLTKSDKYWFDLDAVRVPFAPSTFKRAKAFNNPERRKDDSGLYFSGITASRQDKWYKELAEGRKLGKNPGDVWSIPTESFPDAHFATFPQRLVEPMIKAACPQWICKKCGKARERIIKLGRITAKGGSNKGKMAQNKERYQGAECKCVRMIAREHITVGWTDCGCGAGWDSGIVLDPFAGSGTTCLVAKKLGRHYIGIELNPEYVKMARRRVGYTQRLDKFGLEFK